MKLFIGTVIVRTAMTAIPNPPAALTFLDIARKVHIPRKYAKAIFSTKTAVIKRFR